MNIFLIINKNIFQIRMSQYLKCFKMLKFLSFGLRQSSSKSKMASYECLQISIILFHFPYRLF